VQFSKAAFEVDQLALKRGGTATHQAQGLGYVIITAAMGATPHLPSIALVLPSGLTSRLGPLVTSQLVHRTDEIAFKCLKLINEWTWFRLLRRTTDAISEELESVSALGKNTKSRAAALRGGLLSYLRSSSPPSLPVQLTPKRRADFGQGLPDQSGPQFRG
jgi:hypothetical protein